MREYAQFQREMRRWKADRAEPNWVDRFPLDPLWNVS
jgi:hypothetical protein